MNEFFYTSICREVSSSCRGCELFTLANFYFVKMQYWEDSECPAFILLLHGTFFPNNIVIRLIRCSCFKNVHPCLVKSYSWAVWAKICLLHLIVFSLTALQFCFTKPQTFLWPSEFWSAHGTSFKKKFVSAVWNHDFWMCTLWMLFYMDVSKCLRFAFLHVFQPKKHMFGFFHFYDFIFLYFLFIFYFSIFVKCFHIWIFSYFHVFIIL